MLGGELPSELRPTPVDRQFGAGRKGRLEREEENGLGDFLRRPEALHWNNAKHALLDLSTHVFRGQHLFEDACVDGAGRHRVEANLLGKQLGGEYPSEGSQRSLGGSVCGLASQSLDVGDGGREYDSASPIDQRGELLDRENGPLAEPGVGEKQVASSVFT